jgi:hypothetical protein
MKFCDESYVMSTANFIQIIAKLVNENITKICLTPKRGELLLDNDLLAKLKYLESDVLIQHYFFTSNLTVPAEEFIMSLRTLQKCGLGISLYGYDEESFCKTTNSDGKYYNIFENNLKYIISAAKLNIIDIQKITLYRRYVENTYSDLVKEAIQLGININENEIENFNICGELKNDVVEYTGESKGGICPTALRGTIYKDDYYLCYISDPNWTLKIDNFWYNSLYQLRITAYEKYLKAQEENKYVGVCKYCNEKFDWEE